MLKIKKGDTVIIRVGKNKGKKGIVNKLSIKNNKIRVFVDGINIFKKHIKSNPNKKIVGGIIDKEMSIDYSNVSILNAKTNLPDKVKIVYYNNIKKRIYKSDGNFIKNV